MKNFDLIVIGGGSGGVRAARIAANHGASVALIEEYRLGGTCVIRGCVPKKLMVYASRFAHDFEEAKGYGWDFDNARFDWSTLKLKRDQEVARLEAIYRKNLLAAGVVIYEGHASFVDSKTIQLSDKEMLTGNTILIATGGVPVQNDSYEGAQYTIDSNEFFDLEKQPKKVVIHGAGYIALEFACIFRLLGSEVDVVIRGENILRGFDKDIQSQLTKELLMSGINLHFSNNIKAIKNEGGSFTVALNDGALLDSDCVLRAIGRVPNTTALGLEKIGIALNNQGAIVVNPFSETTVTGIYAVGDVTNRVNLTPMAIREGHAFADTVFGKTPRVVAHDLVPTAVFTTPEVGVVGLTEEQALKQFPKLDVYSTVFRPMKATLSGSDSKVLFKLLVDRVTDRVLGFHSIGHDTGEMIQLLGVALQMKATKKDLDATLAVHPTAAEEWVTFRAPTTQHNL
ncbi:glutathione-disulfide reductase [Polynucleobacter brandtiae]|uniref:NADPH-glutathione reductase n=1 Tax=Polynucleobacter brandtiae TaxID=1938816 RepID=A0A2M8VZU8_9BURK|nr:glutathione-disulfide reductase [Polynucleobacter brandtiae]PJI83379.1 NADPH-glutathione reductase [Polynucleobacter brandtiae]